MTVEPDEAESIMAADPAVQAGMIRIEVFPASASQVTPSPTEFSPLNRVAPSA